jgi:protein-disulfide isomerase
LNVHEIDFITEDGYFHPSEDDGMTDTTQTWRAEPLAWGRGLRQFEMFLEPTCPFSARAFGKLDETLAAAGADNVTIKIRLHSQPWHMYSGVIVRCVLAASTLPAGKEAAKSVLAAVAAHREEFEFTRHCSGPNMDATPNQIIARLENYCGLTLTDAFAIPNLDREVKWHTKYARQNGIHVTPTFMIDSLVAPDMSSGDKVSDWVSRLIGKN